jgi:hypothetical protein
MAASHARNVRSRTQPALGYVPDTVGFDPRGAVTSGRLMQATGRNAVPISFQKQVQETHQLAEAPVRQYVRQPQVTEDLQSELIPIAQNSGGKIRLGNYMVDHPKLMGGTLSLSRLRGGKVKDWPNQKVSPAMARAIISAGRGAKASGRGLKPAEKLMLNELVGRARSTAPRIGADINTTPEEQLKIVMGEIDAGNDNPTLKTQLRKLMGALKRAGALDDHHISEITRHYL